MSSDRLGELLDEHLTTEQQRQAKKGLVWGGAIAATLLVSVLILWVSWTRAGPISTVAYVFFFLFGLTFMPTTILFVAPSFTGGMKKIFGKLHFILGQVAFDIGFLVQQRNSWEMRPGRKQDDQYQVYLDGEWQDVDDGKNMSILGWKPFGIILNKTDDAMQEARVESAGESLADGGSVERGGFAGVAPPSQATEGHWLIDLKRVFTRGLRKMADIDVIEKVEEITMRNEAKGGRMGGWEPIIGSIVGLIIGVATGYVMLGGM